MCGRPLSCGHHSCQLACHEGACPACEFGGARACPCGKVDHPELTCADKVRESVDAAAFVPLMQGPLKMHADCGLEDPIRLPTASGPYLWPDLRAAAGLWGAPLR